MNDSVTTSDTNYRAICRMAVWVSLCVCLCGAAVSAQENSTGLPSAESITNPDSLNEHLEPFRPLLGKTFRSEQASSTAEKPVIDISRFERAMNGQAVRNLHSINDGEYGGETIIMWDAKQQKVAFWYFTTAGFFTQGTFDFQGNTWISIEEVTGNAGGITQVRATSKILESGGFEVHSEYLKNGNWVPGRNSSYQVLENAQVKFQ